MPINQGNVFSSANLCTCMVASLPKEASPQLRDPYDAVAILSHACMIAVGFRLEGLGEDHKLEKPIELIDPRPLPKEWNASSTSNYAFRYAHTQSSLQYILKISRLGSKAIVNGIGLGDDKVHTLEASIKDFLSPSTFPFAISPTDSTETTEGKLQNLFISAGRLTDLSALMKLQIIQKLAPGLRKEGYEESAHAASTAASSSNEQRRRSPPNREGEPMPPTHDPLRDDRLPPAAQPRPFNDPLAAEPRRPYPAGDFPPPGFEDEYEINRPLRPGIGGGVRRPLNIGERDLYPPGLGPHDPLRGGGFGPGSSGIGGGGMHPTFDDPMFGGGGGEGGFGGRAPPGARYDPVGPGDGPPSLRGGPRFPGGGGGGGFHGGRPPNPFGGFGDNDFI